MASFIAYIDESGDEGFQFGKGSSEWFVVACAVFRKSEELVQVKLVDEVRDRINQGRKPEHQIPPKKPLHFRDLKHEQRKFFSDRVGQASVKTIAAMIHKPSLASPETFTEENRLYNYAVRLLVERITWYCRDHVHGDGQDGSVDLVFSNRATLDYSALGRYLEYLEQNRTALGYKAAPGIIKPGQIFTYTSGKRLGLQIADAVASGFFYAVEKSAYGLVEDGYARLMLPKAYRYGKTLWGYGIKIWPREAEERRRTGEIFTGWES